jgi:hypothetical protein
LISLVFPLSTKKLSTKSDSIIEKNKEIEDVKINYNKEIIILSLN